MLGYMRARRPVRTGLCALALTTRACINEPLAQIAMTRCQCVLALTTRVCINQPLAQIAMTRCSGTTRKGTRCTITSTSEMIDSTGRLVALPLRRGGEFCAIHAKPFLVTWPIM